MFPYYPATIYHLKCQWRRSGVFIVNFEYISHLVLVFVINFVQVIAGWAYYVLVPRFSLHSCTLFMNDFQDLSNVKNDLKEMI